MRLIRIIRWFQGLGHSRGFGVQSPFAYHLIREICSVKVKGSKEEKTSYILNKVNALTADLKVSPDSQIIIMKDVYTSREKYCQWKYLIKTSDVDMSFDFFHVCVAVKRKGLSKMNYVINY